MKSILGSIDGQSVKGLKVVDDNAHSLSERILSLREQPLSTHVVNTLAESRLVHSDNESNTENKDKKKDKNNKKDTYIVLYNEFFSGLEVLLTTTCY